MYSADIATKKFHPECIYEVDPGHLHIVRFRKRHYPIEKLRGDISVFSFITFQGQLQKTNPCGNGESHNGDKNRKEDIRFEGCSAGPTTV